MTKGQVTLLVTGLIAFSGFFFKGDVRAFIFAIGVNGIVGCWTNGMAIRMLFDYIYVIPWKKKWALPYSGILEERRAEVAASIGRTVATKLLSTETIMETAREPSFQQATGHAVDQNIRELLNEPGFMELLLEELDKYISNFLDSELFRQKLQESVFGHLGWLGSVLVEFKNVRDKDKITPQMQKEIKRIAQYLCADESFKESLREFLKKLPSKIAAHHSPLKAHLQCCSATLVQELVEKIDVEKVVAEQVEQFKPGEMSDLILKITAENLDWLEVWGGVLGVLGGAVFWVLGRYL